MQFVLTGFSHNAGSRVFAFDGLTEGHTRIAFSVSADLALSRSHGIRVQELPLLCLRFLEQQEVGALEHHLAFAKEDMRRYMDECVARQEETRRKRPPYRPAPKPASQSPRVFPPFLDQAVACGNESNSK